MKAMEALRDATRMLRCEVRVKRAARREPGVAAVEAGNLVVRSLEGEGAVNPGSRRCARDCGSANSTATSVSDSDRALEGCKHGPKTLREAAKRAALRQIGTRETQ